MELPPGSFIASGPVIIEDRKVLLNKEYKKDGSIITPWLFPGGTVEDFDLSLEEACAREAKEEMGISIRILKPLRSIMLKNADALMILVHFLAERQGDIKPGPAVADWAWHPIDALPKDCASNVYTIIEEYKKMSDLAL